MKTNKHRLKKKNLLAVKCVTARLWTELSFIRLILALGGRVAHLRWKIKNLGEINKKMRKAPGSSLDTDCRHHKGKTLVQHHNEHWCRSSLSSLENIVSRPRRCRRHSRSCRRTSSWRRCTRRSCRWTGCRERRNSDYLDHIFWLECWHACYIAFDKMLEKNLCIPPRLHPHQEGNPSVCRTPSAQEYNCVFLKLNISISIWISKGSAII